MCFTLQTPVPEDEQTDWLPGMMGRAPIKVERQQEEEGDEEEEEEDPSSASPPPDPSLLPGKGVGVRRDHLGRATTDSHQGVHRSPPQPARTRF